MHHHTDTDDAPNPVYSSIPESQVAYHQYKANQLLHQVRGEGVAFGLVVLNSSIPGHSKIAHYVGVAGGFGL